MTLGGTMRDASDHGSGALRATTTRTEHGTQLTLRMETELLALSAFATVTLLCMADRIHELPAAVVAYLAAALLLGRRPHASR